MGKLGGEVAGWGGAAAALVDRPGNSIDYGEGVIGGWRAAVVAAGRRAAVVARMPRIAALIPIDKTLKSYRGRKERKGNDNDRFEGIGLLNRFEGIGPP
ncbi:hypothetical protein C4D60_Mb07t11900 [Musa balbisiana]|uniref:Uncharacterized protein n=1 Tax=Musa balbisiana TaxID=52838 RepID=A0A4S8JF97_MUSBA|nr:hypothetical protein C4D60_Mb07t11900 [Musa balbisiana]